MEIFNTLFGAQTTNLSRALSKATARQSLLAANVSNLEVPGYKRKDMDFNITLANAEGSSGLDNFRSKFRDQVQETSSTRQDGNSVDMEQETLAMAETSLRYQTLTQMTASYFSGIKNVIKEGK